MIVETVDEVVVDRVDEKLVRLPRLLERVPFCRSQLYALIAKGKFPKPVKIGERAVAWRSTEIDAWIARR